MISNINSDSGDEDRRLYFGYGSNLWKAQMTKRCPKSTYEGIAKLEGYSWIINDRGYANVVQADNATFTDRRGSEKTEEVVWGLVYALTASDETQLDIHEGVPFAYTKEYHPISFWPAVDGTKPNVDKEPETREMLVYIDRERIEPAEPKREYVYRMNMGIADAVAEGMPEEYVKWVMRAFIPEQSGEGKDEGRERAVRALAEKQAGRFEDEE